ncbi:MAG: response regulator [Segetibacter sp.]
MPSAKNILLVDDDADDLAMLHEALVQVGCNYEIKEAADGEKALQYLIARTQVEPLPALIVLDINMPRLDGKQTLAAIKASPAFAAIPVVIFSTSSNSFDQLFASAYNVEIITKPFDVATLHQIASRLLHYVMTN